MNKSKKTLGTQIIELVESSKVDGIIKEEILIMKLAIMISARDRAVFDHALDVKRKLEEKRYGI